MSIIFYVLATAVSLTAAVAFSIVLTLGTFDTNTVVAQLESSVPNMPEIEQTEAASRVAAPSTSFATVSADQPMLFPTPKLAQAATVQVLKAPPKIASPTADALHRDRPAPRVPVPPVRTTALIITRTKSPAEKVAKQPPRPNAVASNRDRSNRSLPGPSYAEQESNPLSAIAQMFGMR